MGRGEPNVIRRRPVATASLPSGVSSPTRRNLHRRAQLLLAETKEMFASPLDVQLRWFIVVCAGAIEIVTGSGTPTTLDRHLIDFHSPGLEQTLVLVAKQLPEGAALPGLLQATSDELGEILSGDARERLPFPGAAELAEALTAVPERSADALLELHALVSEMRSLAPGQFRLSA